MSAEEKKQKFLRWGKALLGGRWGILAWGISGASAMAIVLWGLKTVAIPMIMLKTASWGVWSFGVIKESKSNLKIPPSGNSPPPRNP
ncbi:MAG TPA: hypothetical protein VNL74_06585 [Methylococcus sp.]|nr:hypothetical protein [Methylococcus sp.]